MNERCIMCNSSFQPRNAWQVVCSAECRHARKMQTQRARYKPALSKKTAKACCMCGGLFLAKTSDRTCSPECRAENSAEYRRKWAAREAARLRPIRAANAKARYRKEPEKHRRIAEKSRMKHAAAIRERARLRFEALSEAGKERIRAANRDYHRRARAALTALTELGIEI